MKKLKSFKKKDSSFESKGLKFSQGVKCLHCVEACLWYCGLDFNNFWNNGALLSGMLMADVPF